MSHAPPQSTQTAPASAPSEKKMVGSARIDAPHVVATPDAAGAKRVSDERPSEALPPEGEAVLLRQLRVQAAQLAEHLRTRQENLDRREAQLHGRAAQLENDTRAARLWLAEGQAKLKAQADELAKRQQEAQQCLARLAKAEKAQARSERHAARHAQDKQQSAEIQTQQLYDALQKDRREFDEQCRREQQRLLAEQRRAQSELDRKRRELAGRSQQVDRCHAALAQLREEVGQMHRSTLEIRLAAEELWAQLAGAAPPAVLTRSLGEIRRQLAEDYRAAGNALAEQKQQLIALGVDLRRQHQHLADEKQRLEQWLAGQEREIDGRAARLVAREQQLDAQQTDFRHHAHQWEMDRLAYQQEIHQLREELEAAKACA